MATVEIRTPGIGRRMTLLAVACLILGALAGSYLGRALERVDEGSTAAPSQAVAGAQPADIEAVRQQNLTLPATTAPSVPDIEAVRQQNLTLPATTAPSVPDIEAVRQQNLTLPATTAPSVPDIEAVRQHHLLQKTPSVPDIEAVRQQNLSASGISR
jgi:hypothetical protein